MASRSPTWTRSVRRSPTVDVHVYPGAGHGFGCDERGSFDAAAAAQATERTLSFLARHLSAP